MLKNLSLKIAANSQPVNRLSRPNGALCWIQVRFEHKIIKVPTMADSISEGELARWEKKVGDFIKQDELVATVETDKIDVQMNSPESGVIVEQFFKEGDSIQVGQDFYRIDTDGKAAASSGAEKAAPVADKPAPAAKKEGTSSAPPSTPPPPKPNAVKTAPKTAASQPPAAAPSKPKPAVATKPSLSSQPVAFSADEVPGMVPLSEAFRGVREVKMNRMRQKISERLKQSQNTAASLTTFNEIDMSSLMEFRSKFKDEILKEHGVKLGFMSAFIKASVAAAQAIPAVNAKIVEPENDNEDPMMVYHDYCDISIAVATPKGLVTPVLRNVEKLNFVQIERAVAEFGNKARDNKISIEDMAGGTFTISNGGVFGSLYGTPIINLPQSGILGMHSIKDRPVAVDGKIEIRPMMYVALTYDHRIVDGREAVTFLKTVKDFVEDPRKLLLV